MWITRVPRTTVLIAAAMVGVLATGLLLVVLSPDPPGQSDGAKAKGVIEGKILAPADESGKASEDPLSGREDGR